MMAGSFVVDTGLKSVLGKPEGGRFSEYFYILHDFHLSDKYQFSMYNLFPAAT